MKGKTASGFAFNVDESKVKEWEFLDILADCESDDESKQLVATRNLVKFLLGDEELSKLIKHIKKNNSGKAEVTDVMAEITGILNALKQVKK